MYINISKISICPIKLFYLYAIAIIFVGEADNPFVHTPTHTYTKHTPLVHRVESFDISHSCMDFLFRFPTVPYR